MARLTWTEPVLRELEAIADYIALESPEAARRTVRTIFDRAQQLEQFPESGREPPELPGSRYRELIIGMFRMFYRVDSTGSERIVYVVHLMRSERGFPGGWDVGG